MVRMTTQRPARCASPSAPSGPDEAAALSVIVPTRNEARNIRPVLTRLADAVRRAVSKAGHLCSEVGLRPELAGISDPMSGFFLVRKSCLDMSSLHPQGFKLLLELLVSSPQASVAEVPYTFDVRHSGVSKAGIGEGLTYLRRLAELRVQARRAPQRSRRGTTASERAND